MGANFQSQWQVPLLADRHEHIREKVAVLVDDAGQVVRLFASFAIVGGEVCKGERRFHRALVHSDLLDAGQSTAALGRSQVKVMRSRSHCGGYSEEVRNRARQ